MCVPLVGAIALSHGPALLITLILLPMTISQSVLSMWQVGSQDLTSRNDSLTYLGTVNGLSWLAIATLIYFQYWLYGLAVLGLSLGIMALAYGRYSASSVCSTV
ncbi:MAG: hypothetical protein WA902_03675 [Thermosynechococcaceae cyanobacterium]